MYLIIYSKYTKRLLDVLISLFALIIFIPIMLIIAVLIKLVLGSPVLFRQERPGKNEKIFVMYKFRTMTNSKDENGNLLSDESRITKLGKFLRNTSLDELPELFNILKNDMSIIGPRPLLVKYLPLYNDFQRKRHLVKPGIVGLAVVHGRNALSWDSKFKYDIEYVDNMSLLLDAKIFILALITVLRRNGIDDSNTIGAKPFTGNHNKKINTYN